MSVLVNQRNLFVIKIYLKYDTFSSYNIHEIFYRNIHLKGH